MKKEIEVTGKTVEEAISSGAAQLGVNRELITYEVIEEPKKGFLGFGETLATVRVTYEGAEHEDTALEFVRTLLADMEIDADVAVREAPDAESPRRIEITGGDSGVLIGHHGATLDALQFIVNLAAGRRGADAESDESAEEAETPAETAEAESVAETDDAGGAMPSQFTQGGRRRARRRGNRTRVIVDVENYRAKREETLRTLARRTGQRVAKYRKSIVLEPMNPYERRIIHSEVQKIPGVTSGSIGVGADRRVQITLE